MAENQRAASAIGLSPDWIADANWALASALAGVATIGTGGGIPRFSGSRSF
jgi:branched-subunit amino acid ABC-type transport system permease component